MLSGPKVVREKAVYDSRRWEKEGLVGRCLRDLLWLLSHSPSPDNITSSPGVRGRGGGSEDNFIASVILRVNE